VKVIWVGPTGESATWESESRMKVSFPELFTSGNFRGRKILLGERVVTSRFSLDLFYYLFMCVYIYTRM